MSAINCHNEIDKFHSKEATLSRNQQNEMRNRRNAGRTRLSSGLDNNKHPKPYEMHSQGSYQMRTMVQDDDNEYDIDDGAYFWDGDLVDNNGSQLTPLKARERVCNALKHDDRLKEEAIVKKNCVRQEYPEGYHIDIPVYMTTDTYDISGNKIRIFELASGDQWIESDARAVTRWYNDLVGELNFGEADGSQLRRITKLSKKFSRRQSWKEHTTSGICITKLVVDHFGAARHRDDVSLIETWKRIKSALEISTVIEHPVLDSNLAESGDKEVGFFYECLAWAIQRLEDIESEGCTREIAYKVWDDIFDTDFFSNLPDGSGSDDSGKGPFIVTSTETARRDDGGGRFG
jgi:hypothetical protein